MFRPRIRTVKPETAKHLDLFDSERSSRLPLRFAYIMLWCHCDREGRFTWEPRRLKAEILPYDDVDFSRVLDALVTRGFIVKYASGGREFGWCPGLERHQIFNNRESPSILPEVPEDIKNQYLDACITRGPRVVDATATRARRNGTERNGLEGNGTTPPTPSGVVSGFEQFWQSYPRKKSKGQAERAFRALRPGEELLAKMLAAIDQQRRSRDWNRDGGQYVPYPASWINAKAWEDEPPELIPAYKANGTPRSHYDEICPKCSIRMGAHLATPREDGSTCLKR